MRLPVGHGVCHGVSHEISHGVGHGVIHEVIYGVGHWIDPDALKYLEGLKILKWNTDCRLTQHKV